MPTQSDLYVSLTADIVRPEKSEGAKEVGGPERCPPPHPAPWPGGSGHGQASPLRCLQAALMDLWSEGASTPQPPGGEAGGLPRIRIYSWKDQTRYRDTRKERAVEVGSYPLPASLGHRL